jgi:hypothetical protein
MKKWLIMLSAATLACAAIVARADFKDDDDGDHEPPEHNPLERGNHEDEGAFLVFGNMLGVEGSFLGSDAIRGVSGATLPRTVGMARGSLGADGRLRINVRGLVLANDASVPAASRGTNDSATFRGLVSCLSEKSGGTMTVNVMTAPFRASTAGNAEINGSVALPAQCLAPIVFVTNAAGDKWLAVIGTERTTQ